jgi:hypothetical protein
MKEFGMWLKPVIVILFVALVISLFTSLTFLLKEQTTKNHKNSRSIFNALTVRLILTSLLIGLLFYGVYTGQLGSKAPWDARYEDRITLPDDVSKGEPAVKEQ